MSRSYPPIPTFDLEPSVEFAPIPIGKIVAGMYQVGSVIGVGTYGEVRHAVSIVTGERVALKIVDLGRFSIETAGLMRKEISILKMLNHQNCIRIIEVHENVPFTGKWCEACACTSFKPNNGNDKANTSANGGRHSHSQPGKFIGITANSACAVCGHSAAEHSGVNYQHTHDDHTHHHPLSYTGATSPISPLHQEDDDEGEARQVMLIVQELAAGGELFSLLSHSGPLPEEIARLYFHQLIDGLDHLHSLGVAHRDLKPENLVLSEDFQLKIADFGLASLGTKMPIADPATAASPSKPFDDVRHYSGVGSQPYSAPEVYYVRELYQGRGYRGPPCDVWSAAIILFVMLVGRPPFVRPLAKTYGAHLRRCRHFVSIMNGQGLDMLNPHAKDLLQKMLKIVPGERLALDEVRKHPWMNGPTPLPEELCKQMEERSMHTWNSSNSEMTHVLSTMRSKAPSAAGSPNFSGVGPDHSPGFGSLNSPSFSASSLPPSPYTHQQAYHGRQTPESISRASPASFHGFPPPNLLPSTHASGLPPPQITRHATIHSATTVAQPTMPINSAVMTIASSINPTSSILHPTMNLEVSLMQMTINDLPEVENEIPPSSVASPAPQHQQQQETSDKPRAEYKDDEELKRPHPHQLSNPPVRKSRGSKLSVTESHEHLNLAEPQSKRMRRQTDPAPLASMTIDDLAIYPQHTSSQPNLTTALALPLATSLSYPPRSQPCSFRSTLQGETLLTMIKDRLSKDTACHWQIQPQDDVNTAATAMTPDATHLGEDEHKILLTTTFARRVIRVQLTIRLLNFVKGRLVIATQLKSSGGSAKKAFHAWFEHFFSRMHEE